MGDAQEPDHHARSTRNWFVCYGVDRITHRRRDPEWVAQRVAGGAVRIVPVWRSRNLVAGEDTLRAAVLAPRDLDVYLAALDTLILLGEDTDATYFAIDLPGEDEAPALRLSAHGSFQDLRSVAPLLDPREGGLLAYARAMTYWHRHHRYCGDCGSLTYSVEAGSLRVCSDERCARKQFPRTDPAVIVLIARGGRCLLARPSHWPARLYSTVAGFVEPGEAVEEAVLREVYEETGLGLHEVRYHSSQPWPFPSSLMLGFTARATDECVRLTDGELQDARWFSRDRLAADVSSGALRIPSRISIAYRLIEDWYDQGGGRLSELAGAA
ncbi:MAG: NAD(+) diphosphatase [Gammaproteobacteria bacterium]|nr:NAD(+) diphosphatase [Gammaproteobacteria bacterium]NIR85121.1 NAD(+) diphosphatase [Gammaproteobacteria bacterium]NIR92050.1 NAD(+) diphosphatase [Gammaproteobacteria bacterium]NIU06170.1 NAD(+) diphosphatase [Gammaproteobacteria bacterium]NIV53169.1 NAD(+) diphosphatase [Gammaproteobacteria bacterium]